MYGNDYPFEPDGAAVGLLFAFMGVFLVLALVALAIGVAFYVLESFGIYTIAKRRGIRKPWLAWIPVAQYWTLGSISDQYQYVAKGNVRNRRKVLLGLGIAGTVLSMFSVPSSLGMLISAIWEEDVTALSNSIASIMAAGSIGGLVSVVLTVFLFIALYDLYNSCNPENATLFLVLSILFSVTMPFFIFFSRNKDLGMPPRKPEAAPQQIPEPPTYRQPPEEPWKN